MLDAAPVEQVVVVTGRGLEASDKLSARLMLTRAEIERSASGRIEDALRDVAGLASFRRSDSRSAHPTSQGLTLRGLGGNAASRVTVSLDGVPQADPFGGWISFTALDPHAIDRISVTRGGGSGLGNIGGTIEIDSRSLTARAPADVLIAGGSHASLDARLLTRTRWDDGFASISGSVARGDGFAPVVAEDRGTADQHAPYAQGSARARLVQSIGSTAEVQLSVSTYRDRRTRGTDYTDNRQRGSDASLRLVGHGASRWSALAYVQDRRFDSQFASVNADRSAATQVLEQRVPARGWGARIEVAPRLGPVELRLGGEWRQVSGVTEEDFRFVAGEPTRKRKAGGASTMWGLFGAVDWSEGSWSAGIEARADRWTIDDGLLIETDLSGVALTDRRFAARSDWNGSGRIALGRKFGEMIGLRAAVYRGWRLPTLNELYRPFRVGPDATAANAGLNPERLRGVEAGIDWTPVSTAKLSASAFANRLGGAIANVTIGSGPGVFDGVGFVAAGGIYRMRQNVDAIVSRGIEVDGSWTRGPWRGNLSYALTDARLNASGAALALDGKRPAQVARHSGSASLGWERKAIGLSATARFTGRQFEDDNNSRALPAAMTFDTRASAAVSRRITMDMRVENLFDKPVIAALASDGTRERALPRTVWLGLRIR